MKNNQSKVYFTKDIEKVLVNLDFSGLGRKVAVKVHFGEKGCNTYIDPKLVRKVFEKIESLDKEPTLVECNVLYKGSRTNAKDHIATARSHGFDLPIEILDGEFGKDAVEIDGCKIGKGIEKFDSLVVLTHFKGHMMAGFGGSLKNIGMGLGSRAGKLDMHSTVKPSIDQSKCIGCGVCVKNCNAEAIFFEEGKAKIDETKCEGCAMCISVCESGAAGVPWSGGTAERLQKKIAQYSAAILKKFPDAIFINVMQNITEQCDCMGVSQKPMMADVGILFSDDIVAIDQASLDLAEKNSNGKFSAINAIDKQKQIEFAKELGLGSADYELVELD
jgi:uncharacterized protein